MRQQNVLFEDGLMKVRWEDMYIDIPFNFTNSNEIIFYKVIRGMQRQITELTGELNKVKKEQRDYIRFKFYKMSNEDAEKIIVSYLQSIKKETPEITLFEISQNLKIPANQIEEILQKLSKEGKVSWVEQ